MFSLFAVVVSACNLEGCGVDTVATPASAAPALQRPGKAVFVSLSSTNSVLQTGELQVLVDFPLVPDHGLYCSGMGTSASFDEVNPCPSGMGYGSIADGGTPVSRIDVILSDDATFSAGHALEPVSLTITNSMLINTPQQSIVVSDLLTDTMYYVRVIVYNSVGPSKSCDRGGQLCDGTVLSSKPKQ
jgi:hypothetical protein